MWSMISNMFTESAKGNVFDSPALSAYSGTTVTRPTIFPFAKGVGLMGEAGPEAVLPLKRGADGKLGIQGSGGGGFNQTVNITNTTDSKVTTKTSSDGMTMDIIIEQIENSMTKRMSRGTGMAAVLDSRYGRRV
jgi:phage-related minor tail protein